MVIFSNGAYVLKSKGSIPKRICFICAVKEAIRIDIDDDRRSSEIYFEASDPDRNICDMCGRFIHDNIDIEV